MRRLWLELDEAERRALTLDEKDAARSLAQRQRRTTAGMRTLDQIELDGRALDIQVDFGEGKPAARPTMLALVERACFKTLAHSIVRSETEEDTAHLIVRCCVEHGNALLTDTLEAFKSKWIAGKLG